MGYNLEPINEQDLDLQSRFTTSVEKDSLRPEPEGIASERIDVAVEKSAAESDQSYQNTLAQVQDDQTVTYDQGHIAQDASDLHQAEDREAQVQRLVDLALTKDVEHAVSVAEHMEDYYVLDRLHDTLLSEDFHNALRERGMGSHDQTV